MKKIVYKIEDFEGPLDLLLHLIKKHKLNIRDIKISELLEQYLSQIELMKQQQLDLSSEFLEMASRLIYIKTLSLLPKNEEADKLKEELTGQLLEYKECKKMASLMAQKINLDFISRPPLNLNLDLSYKVKHQILELKNLYILSTEKKSINKPYKKEKLTCIVSKKIVSVFSKTLYILRQIIHGTKDYHTILQKNKNCSELIATFLAVLELIKIKRVVIDEKNEKLKIVGDKYWKLKKKRQL